MINYTGTSLTDSNQQLKFWTGFNEFIKGTPFVEHFPTMTPQSHNWYDVPLKTSNPYISLAFDSRQKHIRVSVYMKDKSYWNGFSDNKEQIDNALGNDLDWQYKPETKRSYIMKRRYVDFDNPDTWHECYQWYIDRALEFKRVFSRYC